MEIADLPYDNQGMLYEASAPYGKPWIQKNNPSYQWIYAYPWVKTGFGRFDPVGDYTRPGLYGVGQAAPDSLDRANELFFYSIPFALGAGIAGLTVSATTNNFWKGIGIAAIGGLIPPYLAYKNLRWQRHRLQR